MLVFGGFSHQEKYNLIGRGDLENEILLLLLSPLLSRSRIIQLYDNDEISSLITVVGSVYEIFNCIFARLENLFLEPTCGWTLDEGKEGPDGRKLVGRWNYKNETSDFQILLKDNFTRAVFSENMISHSLSLPLRYFIYVPSLSLSLLFSIFENVSIFTNFHLD